MHVEQLRRRQQSLSELTYARDEDAKLENTRARLSNILKRHEDLKERLSRDSDKLIFERLQKEFEAARAAQTEEIAIDDEQWNDGLLATIREKVHMEADRKAMSNQMNVSADPQFQPRTTYRIRNKVIYCLDGARIGIQYETFFAGEPCEIFHCVLESKSFLEKMTVIEHTIPFFLPIREVESDLLSSNAIKFIDRLEEILQAYIDRREQVRLVKELYGNQIGELYHSLPCNVIEFVLEDFECQGYSQYPIFGSSDDSAESGKGVGLATSFFQENIGNRLQKWRFRCPASTVSPFICRGCTQDLMSTRSICRHCAGPTPGSEENFLLSGK
ncbi:hypothetical protein ACP70R_023554 [Stipagrostis hirtigluma subsp. patula]